MSTMKCQVFCIVLALLFFVSTNGCSQSNNNNYSVEQLIMDVQHQQYDAPIRNSQHLLDEIERGFGSQYSDADYVGIISLLSTACIGSGSYDLADAVLSHAIDFLSTSNNNSEIHILYWAKGLLFYNLGDYYKAEAYISEALNSMDVQIIGAENYAVILSTLSTCYRCLNMMDKAKQKIDEAMSYVDEANFKNASLVNIYQKASAVYYDLGIVDDAMQFAKKAYALSKDDENNVAGFFFCASGLATMYSNQGDYQESLSILHQIENKQLVDTQKSLLYQNIYQD